MHTIASFGFQRDLDNNKELLKTRGLTFEMIIEAISVGGLLAIDDDHNLSKYPFQKKFIVEYKGYIYYVPFIKDQGNYILKTIIPSRKLTKQFLLS